MKGETGDGFAALDQQADLDQPGRTVGELHGPRLRRLCGNHPLAQGQQQ
jgi:hypothetical protein